MTSSPLNFPARIPRAYNLPVDLSRKRQSAWATGKWHPRLRYSTHQTILSPVGFDQVLEGFGWQWQSSLVKGLMLLVDLALAPDPGPARGRCTWSKTLPVCPGSRSHHHQHPAPIIQVPRQRESISDLSPWDRVVRTMLLSSRSPLSSLRPRQRLSDSPSEFRDSEPRHFPRRAKNSELAFGPLG